MPREFLRVSLLQPAWEARIIYCLGYNKFIFSESDDLIYAAEQENEAIAKRAET